MEELELVFDENEVYLPQVVAEESKRKANENVRVSSENERIKNENERTKKDAERDSKVNDLFNKFEILKEDVEANLTKTSYLKQYTTYMATMTFHVEYLDLPEEYTELCLMDIFINGMRLEDYNYSINLDTRKIKLDYPLDVIGTQVEIVITKLVSLNEEDYDKLAGYTPIRGVDYWTEEDVSLMESSTKQYIDDQFTQNIDEINGEEV